MSSNKNTPPCSSSDFPPIPKEIWGLGSAVFFVNLASVMVRSFMTIYMKSLGYNGGWIATMNGITEMTSYLMKILLSS